MYKKYNLFDTLRHFDTPNKETSSFLTIFGAKKIYIQLLPNTFAAAAETGSEQTVAIQIEREGANLFL